VIATRPRGAVEPEAPDDRGYAAGHAAWFGIVYEAGPGGSGVERYVIVDRVLGWRTAWSIEVLPMDGARMTQDRLDRMRELVADANARWQRRRQRSRATVLDGRNDGRATTT
jgi:hypothetical protein